MFTRIIGFALAAAIALTGVVETACAQDVAQKVIVRSDTTRADDALLRELEAAMGTSPSSPRARPSTNPDISVIGDLRARLASEGPRNIDLGADELEMAFRSVVDPYARADVFLSIANEDGEFGFELEEAYLTTLALPANLQAKAGKFRSSFGKLNRLHPHALPFIDTPAVYANFFGPEGLNDQGISVSWLVPNPSFYQELVFEITRGPSENESFLVSDRNRLLYAGHSKNFWDLSANATLELGLSAAAGPNATGNTTVLGGVDLTYKWKPVRFNTYKAVTVQAEAIASRNRMSDGRVDASGFLALATYQFARRWGVTGRFDYSDLPDDPEWNETGVSGTLGWYLSEFQKLELGVRRSAARDLDTNYEALFRVIFVIGSHGAHEY